MLRKKVFKILSVLVAVIIAFSCCCISASADSVKYSYVSIPYSKPQLTGNNMYIELLFQDTSGGYHSAVYVFGVNSDYTDRAVKWDVIIANTAMKINSVMPTNYTGNLTALTVNDLGSYTYDSTLYVADQESDFYFSFQNNYTYNKILGYNIYGNYSGVVTSCGTVPFIVNYAEDYIAYYQMQQIITALGGIGSISGNINANANQNTDKITQNQNENADKITQNQNENTEEIKNGWQQDNEIDSSTTDDYAAKDQQLQQATEQGRSEAVSVFNSFGSLFQSDSHLYKGLLSVSAIFTEFMKIDWLSSLLNFSLAIGIFAFVIGTGSSVFKSAHEKHEYKKERKYMSSENSQARREMND